MKFSLFAGVAAALATMVAAQNQLPGNAVYTPNLSAPATAGTPTQIKFDGTGLKTVSLILLKGPSINVLPIGTIASGIPVHDGDNFFSWIPGMDLENLPNEGYGIKLVDDATGNFQYSTQFGIKNDAPKAETTSDVSSATTAATTPVAAPTSDVVPAVDDKPAAVKPASDKPAAVEPASDKPAAVTPGADKPAGAAPTIIYSTEYETLTSCDCTETPSAPIATGVTASTGLPVPVIPTYTPGTPGSWNSTTPQVPASVPSGIVPAGTAPAGTAPAGTAPAGTGSPYYNSPSAMPTQFTGAAGRVQAGGLLLAVFVGMVAFF
ncbi:hypothetical protein EDC01DRAFT_676063 [Geopyxis carbonaria]|nr:hypothetical protein EDC01DRAFT_676063 [Geopyxis carbonaria]